MEWLREEYRVEWLRKEYRGLTRMTFSSEVMLLVNVAAAIVLRFIDGTFPDMLVATSVVFAFALGLAFATLRAAVAQGVRIKRLEDRLAMVGKNADAERFAPADRPRE